jgi:hypothetical protein
VSTPPLTSLCSSRIILSSDFQGRTYPVDIFYGEQPVADYVATAIETVLALHRDAGPGDILVFLTGQEEVRALYREWWVTLWLLYVEVAK